MKPKATVLSILLLSGTAFAQNEAIMPPAVEVEVTETVTPGGTVVEETVTEIVPGAPVPFDPARQLSIVPRPVPVAPAPAPGTVVEETVETTTVNGRTYVTGRNVVIVEGRELPYTTVPVLFEKETAKLLDTESRVALDQTAAAIKDVLAREPAARFDIEGHTSTDGTDEFNITLSADRARRVHAELTQHYLIPAAALTAHGYGETYPAYPNGSESEMMLDRRVLVVRTN